MCMVLHYLVGRWSLAGFENMAEGLEVRCQKCTNMHSFKLPLMRTRDVYVVYPMAYQTITSGAGTLCRYRMQAGDRRSPRSLQTHIQPSEYFMHNRLCATPESSVIVRCTIIVVSLYAAFSKEAKAMVTVLAVHAAPNVFSPYERIQDVLQTWPFP